MKKKLISLLISLVIFLIVALPASAQTILVHDYANLLPGDKEAELTAMAQSIYDSYDVSAIILTTPDLYGQDGAVFADNFYENNRFGDNRVLFLVDMGSRQWYISTNGSTMDLISESEMTAIEDKVIPYLSEGRYYDAFSKFYDLLPRYLTSDADSEINLTVSFLCGAAIAAVILMIMKSSMNTKTPQNNATSYEADGSWHLRTHQDIFLYSNISKRAKPQNNNSGSSGGSHVRRSGKF